MEESLSSEHSGELLGDPLEDLLNGGGVAHKCGSHLETSWRNVANAGHHVVGDPLNEVAAVLVLDVQHLLVDLLHRHAASVRYLPCLGSQAAIMFLASNICWVSSGTVT